MKETRQTCQMHYSSWYRKRNLTFYSFPVVIACSFLSKLSLIIDCILKLCGMVKDLCVDVKLAAFDGLGKITLVSQDVLLQTLTKRVRLTTNMKKFPRHWLHVSASDAAGALLLGLEDEFLEVSLNITV